MSYRLSKALSSFYTLMLIYCNIKYFFIHGEMEIKKQISKYFSKKKCLLDTFLIEAQRDQLSNDNLLKNKTFFF